VPSIDPKTGKRLSGAAQRKRKQEQLKAAQPDLGNPFKDLEPPPIDRGVEVCEAWANDVALLVISAVESGAAPMRSKVLRLALRRLGALKNKARISQLAVEARYMKALEPDGDPEGWRALLTSKEPPLGDPVAGVAWSFLRLCRAAHEVATDEKEQEVRLSMLIEACAAVGAVECKRQQRAVRRG
jgi:hypothetical protein